MRRPERVNEDGQIVCAECCAPLNNGNSHCDSGLCPRCYTEGLNEDRSEPINHGEE